MSKLKERVEDLEYKVHELREEIEVNYRHLANALKLLRKKFPEEFTPEDHLKDQ